ncbi:uncharacterized protein TrAtP1_012388 [Trichoderma atroviride]|uniref:Uncharacterized protein n=1 Tax=Hypocrea atroviridis (strain ATCC 20476 / IMI 206040) TaxID=452589 RepID=G9NPM7_HYPAI|nr:uncharacterized protein TRIATDRAFT_52315 [Trichoderma atroviride IMI 206040]EHK47494.1 hypothetical protein TRIATDRAFT_52315 [Trichoderma atroviride IMI 206040]UKZ71433.1 hypothetical protein TrAtP1_012388 [Trichoderma atroviride]
MATSISPQPAFHLCPDFSIAPPPNGHLQLGSMLRGLDFDSIFSPLDYGDTAEIPNSQLWPLDKPAEKDGFSRSLRELRVIEGSIWAKIFGGDSMGAMFSFLRNRENDETLTVKKIFVRYFIPTPEYMKNALEIDNVAFHINNTKRKKPVYIITGLMWTEGAKLSKVQSKKSKASGQVAATDPHSGTTVGGGAAFEIDDNVSTSFDGSTPFILGIRVRKIWWDKDGTRRGAEDIVGATLGNPKAKDEDVLDGLKFVDDEVDNAAGQITIDEGHTGEEDAVTWILV